jgi:hypothetical protein
MDVIMEFVFSIVFVAAHALGAVGGERPDRVDLAGSSWFTPWIVASPERSRDSGAVDRLDLGRAIETESENEDWDENLHFGLVSHAWLAAQLERPTQSCRDPSTTGPGAPVLARLRIESIQQRL